MFDQQNLSPPRASIEDNLNIIKLNNTAENRYLNIVKYLHNNRNEEYATNMMRNAAENGYLNILDYLRTI